jgi:hypothetical protein
MTSEDRELIVFAIDIVTRTNQGTGSQTPEEIRKHVKDNYDMLKGIVKERGE